MSEPQLTELRRQLDTALDRVPDFDSLSELEELTEQSVEFADENPERAGALATDLVEVLGRTNTLALSQADTIAGKRESVRSIRRRSAEALAGIAAERPETIEPSVDRILEVLWATEDDQARRQIVETIGSVVPHSSIDKSSVVTEAKSALESEDEVRRLNGYRLFAELVRESPASIDGSVDLIVDGIEREPDETVTAAIAVLDAIVENHDAAGVDEEAVFRAIEATTDRIVGRMAGPCSSDRTVAADAVATISLEYPEALEPHLPALVEGLSDPVVREQTATTLRILAMWNLSTTLPVVTEVGELISADDPETRAAAVSVIGKMVETDEEFGLGTDSVPEPVLEHVPTLVDRLDDPEPEVRTAALDALETIADGEPTALVDEVDTILERLWDDDDVAEAAARCLERLGEDSTTEAAVLDRLPALLDALEDPNPGRRERAVEVLGSIAAVEITERDGAEMLEPLTRALPWLITALNDKSEQVRASAASAIKKVANRDPEPLVDHLPALIDGLYDSNHDVRFPASVALETVASYRPSTVLDHSPALKDALSMSRPEIRELAVGIFERIASTRDTAYNSPDPVPPQVEELIPTLVSKLDDASPAVRDSAEDALVEIGEADPRHIADVADRLAAVLESDRADSRAKAATVLRVGTEKEPPADNWDHSPGPVENVFDDVLDTVPRLVAAVVDEEERPLVREAAAKTLEVIAWGHPDRIANHADRLHDGVTAPHAGIRANAIGVLGATVYRDYYSVEGAPEAVGAAVPGILDGLADPNPEVSAAAVDAVGTLAQAAPDTVGEQLPEILEAIEDLEDRGKLSNDSPSTLVEELSRTIQEVIDTEPGALVASLPVVVETLEGEVSADTREWLLELVRRDAEQAARSRSVTVTVEPGSVRQLTEWVHTDKRSVQITAIGAVRAVAVAIPERADTVVPALLRRFSDPELTTADLGGDDSPSLGKGTGPFPADESPGIMTVGEGLGRTLEILVNDSETDAVSESLPLLVDVLPAADQSSQEALIGVLSSVVQRHLAGDTTGEGASTVPYGDWFPDLVAARANLAADLESSLDEVLRSAAIAIGDDADQRTRDALETLFNADGFDDEFTPSAGSRHNRTTPEDGDTESFAEVAWLSELESADPETQRSGLESLRDKIVADEFEVTLPAEEDNGDPPDWIVAAVEPLVGLLNSSDAEVNRVAADLLGEIARVNPVAIGPHLEAILDTYRSSPDLRDDIESIVIAATDWELETSLDRSAVLRRYADVEDPAVRHLAVSALSPRYWSKPEDHPTENLDCLVGRLHDRDSDVREAAATAVGRYCESDPEAIVEGGHFQSIHEALADDSAGSDALIEGLDSVAEIAPETAAAAVPELLVALERGSSEFYVNQTLRTIADNHPEPEGAVIDPLESALAAATDNRPALIEVLGDCVEVAVMFQERVIEPRSETRQRLWLGLVDPREEMRESAERTLQTIAREVPSTLVDDIDILLSVLESPRPDHRNSALTILGHFVHESKFVGENLFTGTTSCTVSDDRVRVAVPAIGARTRDGDTQVREAATFALAKYAHAGLRNEVATELPRIVARLDDSEPAIRRRALDALRAIYASEEGIPDGISPRAHLIEVIERVTDDDDDVRDAAVATIRDVGGTNPGAFEDVVGDLSDRLQSPNPDMREGVAVAVRGIVDPTGLNVDTTAPQELEGVVPVLADVLRDDEPAVRAAASEALVALAGADVEFVVDSVPEIAAVATKEGLAEAIPILEAIASEDHEAVIPFVPELVPLLTASNPDIRADIARTLGSTVQHYGTSVEHVPEPVKNATPELTERLFDEDADVRAAAARTLEQIAEGAPEQIVPIRDRLQEATVDDRSDVREYAFEIINSTVRESGLMIRDVRDAPDEVAELISHLVAGLDDPSPAVKVDAVETFRKFAASGVSLEPETVQALFDAFDEGEPPESQGTDEELRNITDPSIEESAGQALRHVVGDHPDILVDNTDVLVAGITDDDASVRAITCGILAEIESVGFSDLSDHPDLESAVNELRTMVDTDRGPPREAAIQALESISRSHPEFVGPAIPSLIRSLGDESVGWVAGHALRSVARADPALMTGHIGRLSEKLAHPSAECRESTAEILVKFAEATQDSTADDIGVETLEPAVPELGELTDDDHQNVRYAATKAINEISVAMPTAMTDSVPGLLTVHERDENARWFAANAVARIAAVAPTAVTPYRDRIREQLTSEVLEIRAGAALVFGGLAESDSSLVTVPTESVVRAALDPAIENHNPTVLKGIRKVASSEQTDIEQVVGIVMNRTEHPEERVRRQAFQTLQAIAESNPEALESIVPRLCEKLSVQGGDEPPTAPLLVDRLNVLTTVAEEVPEPFAAHLTQIASMLDAGPNSQAAVERMVVLLRAVVDTAPNQCTTVVPVLEPHLSVDDPKVQFQVAATLARIGIEDIEAVRHLREPITRKLHQDTSRPEVESLIIDYLLRTPSVSGIDHQER